MTFLATCVWLAAAAATTAAHGYVSPVILPKVQLASPDVTVVKQPYVIEHAEPVYRNVYYADPLPLPLPYASRHVVAYRQQPPPAVYYHHHQHYHQQPVSYVV